MDRALTDPAAFVLDQGRVAEDARVDLLTYRPADAGDVKVVYDVEDGRELRLTMVDLSPSDVRYDVTVNLGFGSRADIRVASVCGSEREKVFAVSVNHNGQKSYSRTIMAGINQGNGTLRFLGNSCIANGAHGSDTRQEGRITNLSEKSRSEVSPALLIKDDDVKASHGAALGAYDPDAIYYMMSRGLSEQESRKLITVGNLMPVIDSFADRGLAEEARKALSEMGF